MRKNDRREEIIIAAYNLFISKGYDNTSIDEIIKEVDIAKGTFYYYFESKIQLLEAVADLINKKMIERALVVQKMNLPLFEKIASIILSFKPVLDEKMFLDIINLPENIVLHKKVNDNVIENATHILSEVINDNEDKSIISSDNVDERIKMILILSENLFDDNNFNDNTIEVFIDATEKILETKKGSFAFLRDLIGGKK